MGKQKNENAKKAKRGWKRQGVVLPPRISFAPRAEVERRSRRKLQDVILCSCGFSEEFNGMVQCESCNAWQHIGCVIYNASYSGGPALTSDSFDDEYSHTCDACARPNGFGLDTRYLVPRGAHIHKAASSTGARREKHTAFVLGQTDFNSNKSVSTKRMVQKREEGRAENMNRIAKEQVQDTLGRARPILLDGRHVDRPAYDLRHKAIDLGLPVHDLKALRLLAASKLTPDSTYAENLQRELAAHCISRHEVGQDERTPWLLELIGHARKKHKRVNIKRVREALVDLERGHEVRLETNGGGCGEWDLPVYDGDHLFYDETGVLVAYQIGASKSGLGENGWVNRDHNSIREYIFSSDMRLHPSANLSQLRTHVTIDDADHLRNLDHQYQQSDMPGNGERGQHSEQNFYRSNRAAHAHNPGARDGIINHVERAGTGYVRRGTTLPRPRCPTPSVP